MPSETMATRKPTASETCPAYSRRVSTSRPTSSVPSGKAVLGGCNVAIRPAGVRMNWAGSVCRMWPAISGAAALTITISNRTPSAIRLTRSRRKRRHAELQKPRLVVLLAGCCSAWKAAEGEGATNEPWANAAALRVAYARIDDAVGDVGDERADDGGNRGHRQDGQQDGIVTRDGRLVEQSADARPGEDVLGNQRAR